MELKIKICIPSIIVCPQIFMQHIWTIFNKNTQTCQRSAIEINKRGKSHDFLINISLFPPKRINKNEKRYCTEICNGKIIHLFSSWKFSGLLAQFSTFIIWVTIIMLLGMQNHLQPNKLEGVFQKMNLWINIKLLRKMCCKDYISWENRVLEISNSYYKWNSLFINNK